MMLQQMHALGRYLKNAGVTAIFVDETRNVTGEFQATMENISYLADNIVFLRHLEVHGEMRKAIGVLKKANERLRADHPRVPDHQPRAQGRRADVGDARNSERHARGRRRRPGAPAPRCRPRERGLLSDRFRRR